MATRKPLAFDGSNVVELSSADEIPQANVPAGIPLAKLDQSGAAVGQVPKWDGTAWAPANDSTGAGLPVVEQPENVRTSNFTAAVGVLYLVDVSGGSVTVTPPSSPAVGDTFGVSDARSAVTASKQLLVAFGSQRFCGATGVTYNINRVSGTAIFVFAGTTTGWISIK
jgi:hypothetical protein